MFSYCLWKNTILHDTQSLKALKTQHIFGTRTGCFDTHKPSSMSGTRWNLPAVFIYVRDLQTVDCGHVAFPLPRATAPHTSSPLLLNLLSAHGLLLLAFIFRNTLRPREGWHGNKTLVATVVTAEVSWAVRFVLVLFFGASMRCTWATASPKLLRLAFIRRNCSNCVCCRVSIWQRKLLSTAV